MSPEKTFTFLVSRTDAIGDVVLTLPVAGRLKQLFPGCRVVLIGRTYTAPVAAACFHISNPKKPRSARHTIPLLRLGNIVFASASSLVA